MSTLTLRTATPHRLKYELNYDGANDVEISQAALIAACVTGPLKSLLQSITVDADWLALPNGQFLSIYTSNRTSSVGAAFETGGGRKLKAYGCGVGTSMVEVVFLHSISR